MSEKIEQDARLIDYLGGPAKVARKLGYPSEVGTQRVHNWKSRGIPVRVKYEHPEIFEPVAVESEVNQ